MLNIMDNITSAGMDDLMVIVDISEFDLKLT